MRMAGNARVSACLQASRVRMVTWMVFICLLLANRLVGSANLRGDVTTLLANHRDLHQFGSFCPVMAPCFCDYTGPNNGPRAKRIVCGQLGQDFPTFTRTHQVVDCVTLMYTGLRRVPPDAFAGIQATRIDLQGNLFGDRIDELAFRDVGQHLQSLTLAWSNITSLPSKVFRGMLALKNLTLAENRITNLTYMVFQDLRNLDRLSLAGNPIRRLPTAVFRYQTNLGYLDLGYCHLEEIQLHLFSGLWSLLWLDVRGNRIKAITPGLFGDLWSLDTLLLSHNPIEQLQASVFRGLSNLENLEIKEGHLQYLQRGVFADTLRLATLELSDNRLTEINKGVLGLPSVEWLALDGNGLRALPSDVEFMSALVYLDLSYNEITSLDRCVFARLRSLEFLNLRENPFHCNCTASWLRGLQLRLLRDWRNTHMIPFIPGKCATPAEVEGDPVTTWLSVACPGHKHQPCHH